MCCNVFFLRRETEMTVPHIVLLVHYDDGLMVQVRCLADFKATIKSIAKIDKERPELYPQLLNRKNTPPTLAQKANGQLVIMFKMPALICSHNLTTNRTIPATIHLSHHHLLEIALWHNPDKHATVSILTPKKTDESENHFPASL